MIYLDLAARSKCDVMLDVAAHWKAFSDDASTHADGTVTPSGIIMGLMWKYYVIQIRPVAEEKSCLHDALKEVSGCKDDVFL